MLLSTFFDQVNSTFRGSDDDAPVAGTPDYSLWLNTTNRKIADWASDKKVRWNSLFSLTSVNEPGTVATAGTTTLTGTDTNFTDYKAGDTILVSGETSRIIDSITSDTVLTSTVAFSTTASSLTFTHQSIIDTAVTSYNLHRRFLTAADKVVVTTTVENNLSIVDPLTRTGGDTYIYGLNPKKLAFSDDISSTLDDGVLSVPAFYAPADMAASTDTIPVDDPYWLVVAVAADLAFNDLTYEAKTPALSGKAADLYRSMVMSNRLGNYNKPRKVQYANTVIINPSNENS